jgi:hypothetical protein
MFRLRRSPDFIAGQIHRRLHVAPRAGAHSGDAYCEGGSLPEAVADGVRTLVAAFLLLILPLSLAAQEGDPGDDQGAPEGEVEPAVTVLQGDQYSVSLGGYGSFRYELSDSEAVKNSLTFRRFIVTTEARIANRLRIHSEVEYERLSEIEVERGVERTEGGLEFEQELEGTNGSELAIEQAWAQFDFTRALGLRFGAVLPPVGRFNVEHDDHQWNFPRRPLIDRDANVLPAPAAWTEMGLGLVGEAPIGGWEVSYQAYLLNGVALDFAIEEKVQTRAGQRNKLALEAAVSPTAGSFDGGNTADAVAGRLVVSPTFNSEYAVSAYVGRYTPDFLDGGEPLSTLGMDFRQPVGPAYLEGQLLWTRYHGLSGVLEEFARVAVDQATETEEDETATLESEMEVALSGLSDDRYGFWLDLGFPLQLDRFLGMDGARVVPVLRYERVRFDDDLDEFAFADGAVTNLIQTDREQGRLSLGVSFRPHPQAVFHFMYERNEAMTASLIDPEAPEDGTNGFVFGMAFGF